MPGGKGRPAVKDCIFSAAARSALALPSANAATIRSSSISLSAGANSDHATTGLAFDFEAPKLLLRLLKLGLNGLGFFHHAHDIHGVDLLLSRRQRR